MINTESKFKKGLKNIKPTKLKKSVNKMVEMDDLLLAFMISKPGGLGLCTSNSLKNIELFFEKLPAMTTQSNNSHF